MNDTQEKLLKFVRGHLSDLISLNGYKVVERGFGKIIFEKSSAKSNDAYEMGYGDYWIESSELYYSPIEKSGIYDFVLRVSFYRTDNHDKKVRSSIFFSNYNFIEARVLKFEDDSDYLHDSMICEDAKNDNILNYIIRGIVSKFKVERLSLRSKLNKLKFVNDVKLLTGSDIDYKPKIIRDIVDLLQAGYSMDYYSFQSYNGFSSKEIKEIPLGFLDDYYEDIEKRKMYSIYYNEDIYTMFDISLKNGERYIGYTPDGSKTHLATVEELSDSNKELKFEKI